MKSVLVFPLDCAARSISLCSAAEMRRFSVSRRAGIAGAGAAVFIGSVPVGKT